MSSRVLVVAETGCTHGGDLDDMRQLVKVAAQAGADVCKAQWTSSAERMCQRRNAPEYLEAYRLIQFKESWLDELVSTCKIGGIRFGCSVYLPEDVETIAYTTDFLKVASFEAQDQELLAACEQFHVQPIISTGLCDERVLWDLKHYRYCHPGTRLLHCVSAYPTPMDALNLHVIRAYGLDGLSDHTGLVLTGGLAVAAGAKMIEVHYRLADCDPDNPDYPHALTSTQLADYVEYVRSAERAMGSDTKAVQECEATMERYRVTA